MERLLEVFTIMAQQGERCALPLAPQPSPLPVAPPSTEWRASFPEVALVRATCRALRGDAALLACTARMRLGPHGATLLHVAAYAGDAATARAALLRLHCLLGVDAQRVDAGCAQRCRIDCRDALPLSTPLSMALAGGSRDCVELLLAAGASPDAALAGLSRRHRWDADCCGELVCRVLALASPSFDVDRLVDFGIWLGHAGLVRLVVLRMLATNQEGTENYFRDYLYELRGELEGADPGHCLLRALTAPLQVALYWRVLRMCVELGDDETVSAMVHLPAALDSSNRANALWAAAGAGMLERVALLHTPELQFSPISGYLQNFLPVTHAAQRGRRGVVEYLLEHNTAEQTSPEIDLKAAVLVGLAAHVRRIVGAGSVDLEAPLSYWDDSEEPPPRHFLVLACELGELDTVLALLEGGASVHVGVESEADAPLVEVAAGGGGGAGGAARVAICRALLQRGALYSAAQWGAFGAARAGLEWLAEGGAQGALRAGLDESAVVRAAVAGLGWEWGRVGGA